MTDDEKKEFLLNARPFTPRVWKAWQVADRVAKEKQYDYIGTEHLLFGMIENEGVVPLLLRDSGCDLEVLRRNILKL